MVQLIAFFQKLLLADLGKLQGTHLFPKLICLLLGVVLFSQFIGNGPHLLF